jgi:hypothetical protein
MKRFGVRRLARFGSVALALGVVAIVVGIVTATAQATPSKPYLANVHQTTGTFGTITLTLTNDPHASQTLGAANFTPPAGLRVTSVASKSLASWGVSVDSAGLVEFRASSSSTALGAGHQVSAVVTVAKTTACTATPGSATWQVEAKQSNSFSGTPGNDLQLSSASDLTPLGSFVPAPIETVISGIHVPQIVTSAAAPVSIKALDTCGNVDKDYSGATLALGTGLALPDFSALGWSNGIGSATVTPTDVEAGDQFSVNDPTTGISANSVSTNGRPTFDVVETICALPGQTCVWQDKHNPGVSATSTVPNVVPNGQALGLGYKAFANGDLCALKPPLGDSIQIDPYQYPGAFWIYLTYAKSIVPSGPAASFIGCKFDDNAQTWNSLGVCAKVAVAPCFASSNLPGGKLQIAFYLDPSDPRSGGF